MGDVRLTSRTRLWSAGGTGFRAGHRDKQVGIWETGGTSNTPSGLQTTVRTLSVLLPSQTSLVRNRDGSLHLTDTASPDDTLWPPPLTAKVSFLEVMAARDSTGHRLLLPAETMKTTDEHEPRIAFKVFLYL